MMFWKKKIDPIEKMTEWLNKLPHLAGNLYSVDEVAKLIEKIKKWSWKVFKAMCETVDAKEYISKQGIIALFNSIIKKK